MDPFKITQVFGIVEKFALLRLVALNYIIFCQRERYVPFVFNLKYGVGFIEKDNEIRFSFPAQPLLDSQCILSAGCSVFIFWMINDISVQNESPGSGMLLSVNSNCLQIHSLTCLMLSQETL